MLSLYKIRSHLFNVRSIFSLKIIGMVLGNIFYNFSQFFLIIILSKFGTLEMVGQLGEALAISAPVMMFFSFRLYFIQLSDVKNENFFFEYFIIRFLTTILFIIIVLIVEVILKFDINMFLIVFSVACSKGFETISEIYYGYAQKKGKISSVAKSRFLKGILTPLFFWLGLWLTHSLSYGCAGMAVSWFLILLFYDRKLYPRSLLKDMQRFFISFKKRKSSLYSLFKKSFPLGFMGLLVSLSPNIPRYFIEFYEGIQTLGVYTVLSYVATASFLIASPLFHSYVPLLSNHFSHKNLKEFKKLFFSLVCISILAGCILIAFVFLGGRQFLLLFFGPIIASYFTSFIVIIFYASLNILALCLLYTITSLNLFSIQPIIYFFDVIIITLCSLYFIKIYGLIGACYSSCVIALFHIITLSSILLISLCSTKWKKTY